MTIDCAFFGFLATDAESRKSQAGKPWVRLRVGVGKAADIQWVGVAVFGKAAETAAGLKKGDRCYCEGTIKIDSWRGSDGADKQGLSVASFKIEKTHQIGRNRPKRDKPQPAASARDRAARSDYAPADSAGTDFHNDTIPFSPEFR